MDKQQGGQNEVGLTCYPHQIAMVYLANCAQRLEGYRVLQYMNEEDQSKKTWTNEFLFHFLKYKSPPTDVTDEEKQEMIREDNDYYKICIRKSTEYVLKYVKKEQEEYHTCIAICNENFNPKDKLFNYASRSMCRKDCEKELDDKVRRRVHDGTFPGVKELVK